MEKVAIFIDGSNFYHGLKKHIERVDIDFIKFRDFLLKKREHYRTYYYNAPRHQSVDPTKYKEQQRFLEGLKRLPYFQVNLGRLVARCDTSGTYYIEKGVDVKLAVDMLSMAQKANYDTAILVSGDGDFTDAVKLVQDLGKHVENAYFNDSADLLKQTCDLFVELNKGNLSKCF